MRQWKGRFIGGEPENADDYITRLKRLLAEPHTRLYFDTSFLMWLAKAGEPARAQFFHWQKSVGKTRFHVPLWAAHEFFKHRLKKTVRAEFTADVKAFDKAAVSLYEKLRLSCSDELFGFKNSGAMFLDEYRRTIQPLRGMLQLAQQSEQFENSVNAVSSFIDDCLLSGPLDEIILNVDFDERVRNRGVIPPAFRDAHKRERRADGQNDEEQGAGDNSFGDLVFWREVLRHAASVRATTVIILTADRKNDWFENQHGDKGLTETVRRLVQKPRPVPAPHPLLKREAFDKGVSDFVLLDPMYCGVLLETGGQEYKNFVIAALETQLPKLPGKPSAARSWATRFGAAATLLGGNAGERDEDGGGESDGLLLDEKELDSAVLQLDCLKPSTPIGKPAKELLATLANSNVAMRGQILKGLDWRALQEWEPNALIALGRSVLRMAETGDSAATDFLSDLRDLAPVLSEYVRENVYFGALGALYYADDLTFRPPSNSPVALSLLDLVTMPEVQHAATALGDTLTAAPLLYRPGSGKAPLTIQVVAKPSADNKSKSDLQAVKLADTNLITTLQDEVPHQFTHILGNPSEPFDIEVGTLLELVARYHRLPRQLIEVNVDVDEQVRVPPYAGIELDI
ncbi:PIN-like domain-containing protein [Ensifer aridi]|uniref:PIN-like domain-containing protein n=1 Tax=Ensifer aridi TaxID=1708715 RepID=UPI000A104DDB|nr:PIN-like domain-containing protein [Ensifer aridi]